MGGLWHEVSLALAVIILSTDLHIGTCDDQVGVILPTGISTELPQSAPMMKLEYIFVIDAAWSEDMIVSMSRLYDEIMCRSRNITTDINCTLVKMTTNFRSISDCDCEHNTITENAKRWTAQGPLKMVGYNSYGYLAQMPCQLFMNAAEYVLTYMPEDTLKFVFLGHNVGAFRARHCVIDVKRFETPYGFVFTPIRIVSSRSDLNIIPPNFDSKSVAASPKVVIGPNIEIPRLEDQLSPTDIENIDHIVIASFESAITLGKILTNFIHNYSYVQLNRKTFLGKPSFDFSIAIELVGGAVMGLLISTFIIMTAIIVILGFETNAATANEQFRVFYETLNTAQAQVELGRINSYRRRNRLPERRNPHPTPSPLSSPFQVREVNSAAELIPILPEDHLDTAEILRDLAQWEEELRLIRQDRV
uniref:Glycoprotein n=1 Tax=Panagrellus redivivus TaxID=6233 RepID=A0A7E4VTS9_PANRE